MQERIDIVPTNIIIFIIAIIESMGEGGFWGGVLPSFVCVPLPRFAAINMRKSGEYYRLFLHRIATIFSNQNKLLLAITSYGNLLDTTKIAQTL